MRNSKFMRWDVILLGLVVLRTMAQNGFCPMCTDLLNAKTLVIDKDALAVIEEVFA